LNHKEKSGGELEFEQQRAQEIVLNKDVQFGGKNRPEARDFCLFSFGIGKPEETASRRSDTESPRSQLESLAAPRQWRCERRRVIHAVTPVLLTERIAALTVGLEERHF